MGPTQAEMDAYYKSQDPTYRTEAEKRQDKFNNLKKYSDETTQLLCFMVAEAKEAGTYNDLPKAVTDWSERHDKMDTVRVLKKMWKMLEAKPSLTAVDITSDFVRKALKVHPLSKWHYEWFQRCADSVVEEFIREQNKKLENLT
jgi:hypothetical protein